MDSNNMHIVELGTLFEIGSSKRIYQSEWKNSGIPFYRAREIVKLSKNGYVDNELFISEELYNKYSREYGIPEEGDILVTGVGTLGVCYIVKDNDKFYFKDGNIIWLKKRKNVLSEYITLLFKTRYVIEQIERTAGGSTVGTLTISNANKIKIPFPSVEEQQHIVKVLDTISDIIEKRKQQIAKLDELEKSLFIEMFGDPVTNPMGWEIDTLGDVGCFKNGLNFGSDEKGISIYCVGVGDFKNLNTISDISTLEKVSLNAIPPDDYLLKDGDIIFVRSNGNKTLVGRSISIFPGENIITFSGFCIRFRIKTQTIINEYLLHVLKSKSIRKAMHGRGANIQNLNQKILGLLSIPIPPIRYQEDFKYKLGIISNEKDAIYGSLRIMQETYNALMQQYFG